MYPSCMDDEGIKVRLLATAGIPTTKCNPEDLKKTVNLKKYLDTLKLNQWGCVRMSYD